MTIANEVFKTRTRLGWTQVQLADALGVTSRTVGSWERAESRPPPFLKHRLAELEREQGRDAKRRRRS